MKDLRLWRLLQQEDADSDELQALLEQLAQVPIPERFPFFGVLSRALQHPQFRVRQAAIGALAGACGYPAFHALVQALNDAEAAVRLAAVEALRCSAAADPQRWIHVLFHPNPQLRREALRTDRPFPFPAWYLLYLLPDAETAPHILPHLQDVPIPPHVLPLVLDHLQAGRLTRALARRILAGVAWNNLFAQLNTLTIRSYGQNDALLAEAAWAGQTFCLPTNLPADILDPIFDLFWDAAAETEIHPTRGKSYRELLFDGLRADFQRNGYAIEVLAALLVTAVRRGWWIEPAAELFAVYWPWFLKFAWVPREVRRQAVGYFYKLGPLCPHNLSDFEVQDLLESPLGRRTSGSLDLWVLGGLLHLLQKEPIKRLLAWFGLNAVVTAFLEDMEDSASLLALPDRSEQGAAYLLTQLSKARRPQWPLLLGLLTCISPSDELDFLAELQPQDAVKVFQELLRLMHKPGLSLSANKQKQCVLRLGSRIAAGGSADFLNVLAALHEPEQCELGLRILAQLAQLAPEALIEQLLALPAERLLSCLLLVVYCSGFPYRTEMQLALALRRHAHKDIREWALARLPSEQVMAPRTDRAAKKIGRLRSSTFQTIATCPESELATAVAPCLGEPRSGLCAALARRSGPAQPNIAVCAALLGAHDPVEEVCEQFQRYLSNAEDFLHELEVRAVAVWQGERRLPLHGHAWFYRWQEHARAVAQKWQVLPEAILTLLGFAEAWQAPLLRERLWLTAASLLAEWRWHDRPRLAQASTESLASFLIDSLTTDVGPCAAAMLVTLQQSGPAAAPLSGWKERVLALLPDLSSTVRQVLSSWIDARGLASAPSTMRPIKHELAQTVRATIQSLLDLEQLQEYCRAADLAAAEEAALRLLELGEVGVARLAVVLRQQPPVPAIHALASTVSLWPAGSARTALAEYVRDNNFLPEIRFRVGVELLKQGMTDLVGAVLDCVCQSQGPSWFRPADWQRLLSLGICERTLALQLALSPQPHAHYLAVRYLTHDTNLCDAETLAALRAFLETDSQRLAELRFQAAAMLVNANDYSGFPILLAEICQNAESWFSLLSSAPAELIEAAVDAILTAGQAVVDEWHLTGLLQPIWGEPEARAEGYQRVLTDAESAEVRQEAVKAIKQTPQRARKLRKVAETYAWGMQVGRELTGRIFQVEMIVGEELGYTRFEENRLYISPLPLLRDDRHGRDIVEGLLLHELGHHVYHRGPEKQQVWQQAQDEQLHPLLNLVSDEHLERHLRARAEEFGDRLKKLCAYAFQHSTREVPVSDLLRSLGTQAFAVLTHSSLGVARRPGSVLIDSGRVLQQMEKNGLSFARFCRALRMGLGNRYSDPKVAEGLALFKNSFRHSTMVEMLQIARRLREIFGTETDILRSFSQDAALYPSEREMLKHGEGITSEEVRAEVQRVLDPIKRRPEERDNKGPFQPWLNVHPSEHFDPIQTVIPLPFDPAAQAQYAGRIQRHARQMRRYLDELGLAPQPQRLRLRGKALDRTRLPAVVLRGDPRMLIAREWQVQTDLFLGVVIDCSGSMQAGENIEKAKLFGTLLAVACRTCPGIDLRLFGFTETSIYDAGNAHRCAVQALQAEGGNNDAAGLWHAAQLARATRRRVKLLVMISDGLPTHCSEPALKALVNHLTRRLHICCAQVSVRPLEKSCFPHYVLLEEQDLDKSIRQFGKTIAGLVQKALRGG